MKILNTFALMGTTMFALGTAGAQSVDPGTEVQLRFEEEISSRTAKVGDTVRMTVAEDVMADGSVVIRAGTKVTGIVEDVNKRGRYGKNGRLVFRVQPLMSNGQTIYLRPAGKGAEFRGSRTDEAAAVTGGGLLLLGPVGALGGYFVVGKPMIVREGMMLKTQVATPEEVAKMQARDANASVRNRG